MRLLFATDLHGRPERLDGLQQWVETFRPQVLLIGGDALPDGDPLDPPGVQVRFLLTEIRQFLERILARSPVIHTIAMPGNHDWLYSYDAMISMETEGLLHIVRPDETLLLAGHAFSGYACTPPTPCPVKDFERLDLPGQSCPFEGGFVWDRQQQRSRAVDVADYFARQRSIQEELAAMPLVEDKPWILLAHAPPLGTDLDLLSGVGHVGSQSIRDFILARQPLLSLHGHIHESPRLSGRFWQRLGQTIAVNPGQPDEGLAGTLIDLANEVVTLTPLGVEGASGQAPVRLLRPTAGRIG